MANRYWVGGAGTWNTTSTTNWSTASGGSSGASVPTASDDVFFDQAGTYTVTCTGALTCRDITVSAGTVTFATGTSPTFAISGSMSLVAATVWSATGAITFNSTITGRTVTTNGISLAGVVTFSGIGGGWTLGSALSCASTLSVSNGTFDSGSYSITATTLSITGTGTRTVNLNSSTVTCSATSTTAFNAPTTTNLTFNAGTSQINFSGTTSGISSTGLTFNNVSFTNAAASSITITGVNTFNTLSFAGRTTVGITLATFSANQTITTLTLNPGTSAAYRTFLASSTTGTQRTLSVGTLTSGAADYDFRDIAITGSASPIAPTRAGDAKGNSGITFPSAKTVYYRQTGSANWGVSSTGSWSLTSGGSLDATAFPLAQDTAVFPSATYPASGSTTTINANYNIGTIDMSLRTSNTMTLATGTTTTSVYGNWVNGTGTTLSGTGSITFAGRGSQTITSSGKTFTHSIVINSPSGSVTLQDAYTTNNSGGTAVTLTYGTLSLNSYSMTLSSNSGFSLAGAGLSKTLDFGTNGTLSLAAGFNASASSNFSTTGTGTISFTGASAKTFTGGDVQTYPTLNQGGTGSLTVSGSNKFISMTNTAIGSVLFTGGTTNEFSSSFDLNGVSGNLLTLGSTNTTQAILKKPGAWNVGANSTDGGNNTGLSFI